MEMNSEEKWFFRIGDCVKDVASKLLMNANSNCVVKTIGSFRKLLGFGHGNNGSRSWTTEVYLLLTQNGKEALKNIP